MLAGTSVARSHHVHIDHRSEVTEVIIPQIARDITESEPGKRPRHRHHQLLRGVDGPARTGLGEHTEKLSGPAVTSSSRYFVPRV